jgi:hypothetical protein
MQRVLNWLRRAFRADPTPSRPRAVRPQLERLDDRLVPTVSSAITTTYSWGAVHDFYVIDQTTHQVVDLGIETGNGWTYQYRRDLGGPQAPHKVGSVSASINPATGSAEVFALDSDGALWLFNGSGTWKDLGGPGVGLGGNGYSAISATRDGHVYTNQGGFGGIQYIDSNGNATDLGRPVQSGYSAALEISAGNGRSGENEVFAIGWDNALYVNSGNTAGGWRLVDNSARFTKIAGTRNDEVFALDSHGHLHQEFEQVWYYHSLVLRYWSGQDISSGMTFQGDGQYGDIYADVDASGQDQVYAFGGALLDRYSQGTWHALALNTWNGAGADGGVYFTVDVWGKAWAVLPSGAGYTQFSLDGTYF